jgi:hypothetical protein
LLREACHRAGGAEPLARNADGFCRRICEIELRVLPPYAAALPPRRGGRSLANWLERMIEAEAARQDGNK